MGTRIKDLTNDAAPVAGDAVPIDSSGSGTRKTLFSVIAGLFATLLNGVGLQSDGGSPAKLRVKDEVLFKWGGDRVQDAAASTATGERVIHINETGVTQTVASVDLTNSTTLAGNDTNNFTMTIRRRNSAGTAATIVAYTNNVASGGITAWILKNLGALANTAIAAGECITLEVTKAGTGQALLCRVEIKLTTPG